MAHACSSGFVLGLECGPTTADGAHIISLFADPQISKYVLLAILEAVAGPLRRARPGCPGRLQRGCSSSKSSSLLPPLWEGVQPQSGLPFAGRTQPLSPTRRGCFAEAWPPGGSDAHPSHPPCTPSSPLPSHLVRACVPGVTWDSTEREVAARAPITQQVSEFSRCH